MAIYLSARINIVFIFSMALLPPCLSFFGKPVDATGNRTDGQDPDMFTLTLIKQYVPMKRNGQVVAHKTAYFGHVFIGQPAQDLRACDVAVVSFVVVVCSRRLDRLCPWFSASPAVETESLRVLRREVAF